MKRLLCICTLLAILLCQFALAGPADRLFVFHGAESYASVYDASTLERVATVAAEPGAFAAFGLPVSQRNSGFAKYYVLSESAIVVLGGDFETRGRVKLPERVAARSDSAALSVAFGRLLVIAGGSIHIVNTATDAVVVTLQPKFVPLAVAVRPGSSTAYVSAADSNLLAQIDLVEGKLLEEVAELPALLTTMAVAGDGSRFYGGSFGSLFDMERLPQSFFRAGEGRSPVPAVQNRSLSIDKLLVSGSDRFFARANGEFLTGKLQPGEPIDMLRDPANGEPLRVVDMAVSPDGGQAVAALAGEARLLRFDLKDTGSTRYLNLGEMPSGLALVTAPGAVRRQRRATPLVETPPRNADQIVIVSGGGQLVESNSTFTFVVETRFGGAPEPGVELTLTTAPQAPIVNCPVTVGTDQNGRATIVCSTGSVATNTAVLVQVSQGLQATVTFSVTILASGTTGDGLRKVSGDNQFVLQGAAFPQPMVVSARDNGLPQISLMLTVTPSNTSIVFCPAFVFTDGNGEGNISCSAGVVTSRREVEIDVEDGIGRELPEPFHATITTELVEADKLELLTDPALVEGEVGSTVLDAIRVRALDDQDEEVEGVPVYFSTTDDLTLTPEVGITNSEGITSTSVTFGCPLNQGNIFVGLRPRGRDLAVPFRVTPGPATVLQKLQGDNQSGSPGELLDQAALLVELTDICGNPTQGEFVTWTVNPPQAAELVNFVTTTDFRGRSGGVVRLGNFGGAFTITASVRGITAVFNLAVINFPTRLLTISGNGQTVALMQTAPQPLVVEARTDDDIPVGAVDVSFRVITGTGVVTPETVTTDNQGRAAATLTAGDTLGPIIVEASGAGLSVRFTINTSGRVPSLTVMGFVDGASFRPGWVPGGTGTIFGSGLMEGINGIVQAQGAPFPTVFQGISVSVNGQPLPILGLANVNGTEQINVQVAFDITPGPAAVAINNNGSTTTVSGVQILEAQPGIFEVFAEGGRFAAALHSADYSLVTPSNPARPDEIILLFLTGMGPVQPLVGTNVAGPVPPATTLSQPVVGIDNAGMQVVGSFYAPELVSVYQINFRVGANVQSGNRTLVVIVNGVASQPVMLPVGQ